MEQKHGPWTIRERTRKYQHELLEVYEDSVIKPDGQEGIYATAHIKPGVSVLALDEEGFVYLAREFRYAVGRETHEVVGGAIDDGEQPHEAARRELREELGIEADELVPLGHVDPMPSMVDSPSHLFLARGLTIGEPQQEGSETIRRERLKLEEAVRMVLRDDISHGSSCVLILRADAHLRAAQRK